MTKGKVLNPCPGSDGAISVSLCILNGLGQYVAICKFCKRYLIVRKAHESKPEITTGTIPCHSRTARI